MSEKGKEKVLFSSLFSARKTLSFRHAKSKGKDDLFCVGKVHFSAQEMKGKINAFPMSFPLPFHAQKGWKLGKDDLFPPGPPFPARKDKGKANPKGVVLRLLCVAENMIFSARERKSFSSCFPCYNEHVLVPENTKENI